MSSPGLQGGRPAKVLVTKIGFDGHDRGSRIVAAFLRDAGMEVVYTGPWQTVENVVNLALQEDVDVIGISSLATDHLIVPKLMEALKTAGLGHIAVVVGGIVPDSEVGLLTDAGVAYVFHPGASRDQIVNTISGLAANARASA
ncbi:MAG: cobalamin-dependent protein [Rhodocyclaceae bacterium]|jgi:methylmalonyl-CoA mutase C-terminal domain/subunit|nr:cobalamin-dependent protein [Rhodocyclaceae bacterium]